MITADDTIKAFSYKLRPWDCGGPLKVGDGAEHSEITRCTVFADKYTAGDQPSDGIMSVAGMLLECWPCDVHFCQYTHRTGDSVRCLKAHAVSYDLQFRIATYDADFHGHTGDETPTPEAFATFVMSMWMGDYVPNYVYSTRRGARIIFCIECVNDPETFEAHYGALLDKLAEPARRGSHGYYFDLKTKDWGRLFRAPRIIRDGVEEYHHAVRILHTDLLDIRELKVRTKKVERKPIVGNQRYTVHDNYLLRLTAHELVEGQRHEKLRDALNYIYRRFCPEAAGQWVENLYAAAMKSGFDDREFWDLQKSVQKYVEGSTK